MYIPRWTCKGDAVTSGQPTHQPPIYLRPKRNSRIYFTYALLPPYFQLYGHRPRAQTDEHTEKEKECERDEEGARCTRALSASQRTIRLATPQPFFSTFSRISAICLVSRFDPRDKNDGREGSCLRSWSFCFLLILIVRCLNFNTITKHCRPNCDEISDPMYPIVMDVLMNYANAERRRRRTVRKQWSVRG